jgi:GTP-binding protein
LSDHKQARLDAEFLCSALTIAGCPRWNRVEIAVAGRSNVGKSSVLNALARRKNLARVSKTPGRTRCLNFFTVGQQLALVDLPGYGYAKMAHLEAEKIAHLLQNYLRYRRQLRALVLLVDARRGPEKEEFTIARLVRDRGSQIWQDTDLIVAVTKCDKLKRSEREPALERLKSIEVVPSMCSTISGEGIDELRRKILHTACAPDAPPTDPAGIDPTRASEALR